MKGTESSGLRLGEPPSNYAVQPSAGARHLQWSGTAEGCAPAAADGERSADMKKGNAMSRWQMRRASLCLTALILGAAAFPAPAAEQPQQPSVTLPAALARVLTDYETAWQKKDASALAALFADDGFVLSSGTPPVRGRAQIEKHYSGAGGPLALRAIAFATEGSIGYIIGGFAPRKGQPDTGKFTLTLHKGPEGRWFIMSDMDNGNARP